MVDETAPARIDELFEREYARLVRAALLLVGDLATAEDIVQDAFVAAYHRWDRLRDTDRAGGYLYRAVINGSRSVLRHRLVVRRHELVSRHAVDAEDTAHVVIERLDRARVIDTLAELPRRQREVLVLRYFLGLSEAQIAEALRISTGSVKTHASRGTNALRTHLHPQSGGRR